MTRTGEHDRQRKIDSVQKTDRKIMKEWEGKRIRKRGKLTVSTKRC